MVPVAWECLSGLAGGSVGGHGSGSRCGNERRWDGSETPQSRGGVSYLHPQQCRVHPELWRTLSPSRAHRDMLCRINGQAGREQAHGEKTTDAMDPTRRPSPAADSHAGVEWRVGRDVPHLVSRFSVPYATHGGLSRMAGGHSNNPTV